MKNKLFSCLTILISLSSQLSISQNSIVGNMSIKSPTSQSVGDVKCMQKIGDYLYTGYWGSSDIKVFDITTAGNPILVNTQSVETPSTGSCSLLGMTTANGLLYVVSRYTDKLYIIDVSDPLNLIVTGTLSIPTNNNDIIVDGNFAYISTVDSGGPLTIVDVSDSVAPTSVSSTSLGSGTGPYYCYDLAKFGDFVYVNYYNNGGFDIKTVDVSTPSIPVIVNTLIVPGGVIYSDLNITGNVLYFSYKNNNTEYLRTYDLSIPSAPVFGSDIVLSGATNSLNYDGQYLYAGCKTSTSPVQTPGALTIFDISTPLNPVIIAQSEASYTDPSEGLFVVDGWVYASDNLYDKLLTFPINCVTDETVSITDIELCPSNTGTTVTIPSSELYSNYYLRDNTNDTIIDGPFVGDGNLITFNTGVINSNMTYNVYAELSQYNNSLNFDGTDDYVQLPNESNYDFTTNMTVEFMINTIDLQTVNGLITKGDDSWRIHGGNTVGKIMFAGNGAFGDFESTSSVDDGVWHHVAVTYDGVNAKIYIDGNLENSVPATNPINNSAFAVALGENLQATNRYFNGTIDEVRIWNIARSATEINAFRGVELQGTETGLVSYFNFNQGVAGGVNSTEITVFDVVALGNDGVLNNYDLSGLASNWIENNAVNCQFELSTIVSVIIPMIDVATSEANFVMSANNITATSYQWINCRSNTPIAGETNSTYTVAENGDYAVIITEGNCSDTSACVTIAGVGINEYNGAFNIVELYPNPNNGEFTLNTTLSNATISIYGLDGKLISSDIKVTQHIQTINLENVENGIYFVTVKNKTNQKTIKLIIQ